LYDPCDCTSQLNGEWHFLDEISLIERIVDFDDDFLFRVCDVLICTCQFIAVRFLSQCQPCRRASLESHSLSQATLVYGCERCSFFKNVHFSTLSTFDLEDNQIFVCYTRFGSSWCQLVFWQDYLSSNGRFVDASLLLDSDCEGCIW